MAKLRVAVIGAGNMGRNHIRNYLALQTVELVAIVDPAPAAKKLAQEYKTAYYADFKRMVENEKPQAVSVVVPTPFHLEVGSYMMKRGIHCLIEKPIAYQVKEADQLIRLARQHDVIFTVGHIERYNPIILKLKELVDNNKLGKITSIVCKRVGGFPKLEPKTDVIIDLAVHDIDLVNFLLGRYPKKIYSHGSRTHHSNKIDAAELLLDYGTASGFIQANWVTPVKIRTIAVTGSKGFVEGNYITQELVYYEHNMEKQVDNFANFVITMGEPKQEAIPITFQEPLIAELKAFIHAIKKHDTSGLVDPKDAREALKITLKALQVAA